jgi:hypothetical protein
MSNLQDCSILNSQGFDTLDNLSVLTESSVSRRRHMTLLGRNVLLVGHSFHPASTLAGLMCRWKLECHFTGTMRAACDLYSTKQIDLLLSNLYLPDGTGCELLTSLPRLPMTAFLCMPVENSCLWLPAIDGGRACLGLPALRPSEFGKTLEKMARDLTLAPGVSKLVPRAEVA